MRPVFVAYRLHYQTQLDQQLGELFQTEFWVRDYPKVGLFGRFVVPCVLEVQRLEAAHQMFEYL